MSKRRLHSRGILVLSLGIGLFCGALSLTSAGKYMEEEWGLKLLFRLRGARPAPESVVLVSLDRNTANKFDLPHEPEKWPRKIYADLIRYLSAQGASIIAIDVLFSELHSAEEDAMLARAIADSGRVILVSDMKRDTVPIDGDSGQMIGAITVDSVQPPHAAIAEHALGIAPFPIPKDLSLAKQFWLYSDNNPHLVTFPVLALHAFFFGHALPMLMPGLETQQPQIADGLAAGPRVPHDDAELHRMIAAVADGVADSEGGIPLNLLADAKAGADPLRRNLKAAWVDSFHLGAEAHFNHYGPIGTIPTISASRLLGSGGKQNYDFNGKVVFVGYSEDLQPQQNHGFFTYFSDSAEDAVSSAELAAVAFGNLLDRSAIKPLPRFGAPLIALVWSLLFGLLAMGRLTTSRFLLLLAICSVYFAAAYGQFRDRSVWLPFVLPLWIESPVILLSSAVGQYLHTRRERQQIYSAFRHYIPESVVARILAEGIGPNADQGIAIESGICLSTDAGQYTKIAEALDPMALAALMNRYYGVVFPTVTATGGFISDVVGDAVMALWIGENGSKPQCQAVCLSALAMQRAVVEFGQAHRLQFPIRIGINGGPFRLGNVGSTDRLEYRATGDTVNTASRIENLCKRLGCGILVSDSVIRETHGLLTRRLGEFLLEGKSIPIIVHDLWGVETEAPPDQIELCRRFFDAEIAYRAGTLDIALSRFEDILSRYPDDKPSRFYVEQIGKMMELPLESRNTAVIAVSKS